MGVAGKDRSAILMAGRAADAAYWYEGAFGGFASSTYYMPALPPWLDAWNAAGRANALAGRSWTRLLPDEAPYLKHAGPDDVKGEWDNVDTVFPHRVRGTPALARVLRRPAADAVRGRASCSRSPWPPWKRTTSGRDDATDLLAVGFSATDVDRPHVRRRTARR